MIEIENLTKSFKRKKQKEKFTAVDHVSFSIKQGEILGFIGKNGAGKTTTLKMLSGLILPDEGKATIDGYDIVNDNNILKNKIGLLAGEFVRSFYWRLNAKQNLKFFATLKNMKNPDNRIDELLEMFQLTQHANEPVMKFSTGMKHKLALCVGLLSDPPILFLDEPLSGIDPSTQYIIKKMIKNEFKNKTIIWASHNLYEVEEMCDRIALIHKGKIVFLDTPEALKQKYHSDYQKIIVSTNKPNILAYHIKAKSHNKVVEIKTNDIDKTLRDINKVTSKYNISIYDITTKRPSIEDIFMEVVND